MLQRSEILKGRMCGSIFYNKNETFILYWSCGVMVSTLDFESKDPSSNLGRTLAYFFFFFFFFLSPLLFFFSQTTIFFVCVPLDVVKEISSRRFMNAWKEKERSTIVIIIIMYEYFYDPTITGAYPCVCIRESSRTLYPP